jgi:Leucine-rich repeat (LRR) protein
MPSVVNKIQDFSSSVSGNAVSGVNNVLIPLSAEPETNFDVTADWSLASVTDQASFEAFLTSQGATSIVVTYFDLTDGRLQALIDVEGLNGLLLNSIEVSEVFKISGFDNSLNLVSFSDNQIETFNPTIAIPSSVETLDLSYNSISEFNPSIPLPSNLIFFTLAFNSLSYFNPSLSLPTSVQLFFLNDNQIATSGYITSEDWATAQPSFSTGCDIFFENNINSVTGTDLETILLTKNTTINP